LGAFCGPDPKLQWDLLKCGMDNFSGILPPQQAAGVNHSFCINRIDYLYHYLGLYKDSLRNKKEECRGKNTLKTKLIRKKKVDQKE
jgi:hypothetical protein